MERGSFALAHRTPSAGFRKRFEETVGARPRYFALSELRRLSLRRLLQQLRSLDGPQLFLLLEDEDGRGLLPVLHGLAALTRAREIRAVFPDLSWVVLPRWRAALALSGLAGATLSGQLERLRTRREVAALARAPRIEVPSLGEGPVLYLKSNLSLGVRAGGSVGHTAGVVNGLVACGRGVDFVSAEAPVLISPRARHLAVPPLSAYGLPPELNLYRFQRRFTRRAVELCRGLDHAFVYQRLTLGSHAGVALSRALGRPLVLEYNGPEAWAAKHWGTPLRYHALAVATEELCLRHAHLVVVVSDVLRDQLLEKGLSRERIVFHPNGIDPDLFDPGRYGEDEKRALRRHYGIEQDAVVVTFVSTFGRWHGAGVLATAIRELAEGESEWLRRHRVHFLVVGDGIEMPAVREVLGSAACAPFVTLTGLVRQADAPLHLAVSDLFLSPHVPNPDGTPFFGSPTKLFEYMAMGRGVIASELNQIGDVLAGSPRVSDLARRSSLPVEEDGAVLTEPGSPGDLVAAIRFMVENPAWREQSAIHARQRALSLYTWRHHVEHILAALREVLP